MTDLIVQEGEYVFIKWDKTHCLPKSKAAYNINS